MDLLVNVDVENLAKAADFYCKSFDLRIGRRFGTSAVELLGASSTMYLLEKPAGSATSSRTSQRRQYHRHWTPVHLDFVVGDVEAAVVRTVNAGARQEGDIHKQPWGKIALMSDPFGNGFCLLEFVGRGYDEIAE